MIGWRKQPKSTGAGHADDIRREPKSQRLNSEANSSRWPDPALTRERRDRREVSLKRKGSVSGSAMHGGRLG